MLNQLANFINNERVLIEGGHRMDLQQLDQLAASNPLLITDPSRA